MGSSDTASHVGGTVVPANPFVALENALGETRQGLMPSPSLSIKGGSSSGSGSVAGRPTCSGRSVSGRSTGGLGQSSTLASHAARSCKELDLSNCSLRCEFSSGVEWNGVDVGRLKY